MDKYQDRFNHKWAFMNARHAGDVEAGGLDSQPLQSIHAFLPSVLSVSSVVKSQGGLFGRGCATPGNPRSTASELSRHRGSITLVVLCFVAVLGIGLAGYLAVTNQSMKLSNRSYVSGVSEQLAESGLEQALRSFNQNDWSGWTISGTTAKRTVTFPNTKYGSSGLTGSFNLRVDHYGATVWNANGSYNTTSVVWYRGIWFQCIQAHSPPSYHTPPNATYWTSAPAAWSSSANYNVSDIALVGGLRYVCSTAHSNQAPPNATYWSAGSSVAIWNSATSYAVNDVALVGGTAYRCIVPNSNQTPPNATYWISAPVIYAEGVGVLPDIGSTTIKTQLHATIAVAPLFPNAVAASSALSLNSGGVVDSYNAVLGTYNQTTAPFSFGSPNVGYSAVLAGGTAVTVTSTTISGYVAAPSASTSPYAPLATFGTSPAATVKGASSPASPNVDLTRVSRSPFIPQFGIVAPSANDTLANVGQGSGTFLNQSATLGTPGATTPSIYNITATYDTGWPYPGLDLWANYHILNINGPVILNVTGLVRVYYGSLIISGTPSDNASLKIIFTGDLQLYNTGTVDNRTKLPERLAIYGTTSLTSPYLNQNPAKPFYGVIYLPNARFTLQGSQDIYGAFSAKNITFANSPRLHYDTSLRTTTFSGVDAPYMISEWRQLTDPAEKVTLP